MNVDSTIKSRFDNAGTIKPKDKRLDSEVKVCVAIADQGLRCGELNTNFVRGVLVSKLYPYFFDDTFTVNMPLVTEFGEPFQPIDFFQVNMPTVSSIILNEPLINRTVPSDLFSVNMPTVQSISLTEVVKTGTVPNDLFSVNMPTVQSITLTRVLITIPYPDGEEVFRVDMPTVQSIILGS